MTNSRFVRVLLVTALIVIGMAAIELMVRPPFDPVKWILGCATAYLVAETTVKRKKN